MNNAWQASTKQNVRRARARGQEANHWKRDERFQQPDERLKWVVTKVDDKLGMLSQTTTSAELAVSKAELAVSKLAQHNLH